MKPNITFVLMALASAMLVSAGPRPPTPREGATLPTIEIAHQCETSALWRYRVYAIVAEEEGLPQIANYFRAISRGEVVHRDRFERLVADRDGNPAPLVHRFTVGTTAQNLEQSIVNEHEEWISIYPYMKETAYREGQYDVSDWLDYAKSAEASHEEVFRTVLGDLQHSNPHLESRDVFICPGCGCALFDRPQKSCPHCRCGGTEFLPFESPL